MRCGVCVCVYVTVASDHLFVLLTTKALSKKESERRVAPKFQEPSASPRTKLDLELIVASPFREAVRTVPVFYFSLPQFGNSLERA